MAQEMADGLGATDAPDVLTLLGDKIDTLDPLDDAHWTKAGAPDLNVLTEYMGTKVKRKDVKKARPGFDRELAGKIKTFQTTKPVETEPIGAGPGEILDNVKRTPGVTSPAERDPIDLFEEMLENTPTQYRRFNPMFNQALQSYEANRPGILEQRERNKARGRA